jgi:hypothetical protein
MRLHALGSVASYLENRAFILINDRISLHQIGMEQAFSASRTSSRSRLFGPFCWVLPWNEVAGKF